MKKRRSKKRESEFSLKNQYKLSWGWIKECKKFIWIIVGVFVVFFLFGFLVPASSELKDMITKFIQELVEKTQYMSGSELVGFIFFNNLQSSFFGFLFGVLLGVFPILTAIANGYLLGFVGAMSVDASGFISLWRILPHGIFELPAVFIALGMGMKFGTFVFQKERKKAFLDFFVKSIRVFVFVVLPLLIVAAIIEGGLIVLGA